MSWLCTDDDLEETTSTPIRCTKITRVLQRRDYHQVLRVKLLPNVPMNNKMYGDYIETNHSTKTTKHDVPTDPVKHQRYQQQGSSGGGSDDVALADQLVDDMDVAFSNSLVSPDDDEPSSQEQEEEQQQGGEVQQQPSGLLQNASSVIVENTSSRYEHDPVMARRDLSDEDGDGNLDDDPIMAERGSDDIYYGAKQSLCQRRRRRRWRRRR